MYKYESKDLWNFEVVNASHPYFKYKFTRRKDFDRPTGNGIYMWVANLIDGTKFVCYTGKYVGNKDKVYEMRWCYHINSKTHKGVDIGFGNEQKFLKTFKPILEEFGADTSLELFEGKLKQGPAQAAKNRTRFSLKYWDTLDMNNPFTIYWFPVDKPTDDISYLEAKVINPKVNGEINNEYNSEVPTLSVEDAIKFIEKTLY